MDRFSPRNSTLWPGRLRRCSLGPIGRATSGWLCLLVLASGMLAAQVTTTTPPTEEDALVSQALQEADAALRDGEPARALELLIPVERLRPDVALLPQARALLELGALDPAARKLRQAVERFPEQVEPRLVLALILRDSGRSAEALEVLEDGAALMPDERRLVEQLALLQLSRGEHATAWSTARDGLERGLDGPLLRLAAGAALSRIPDRREAAVEHLERAQSLEPPDPGRVALELGSVLAQLGRHEEAVAPLRRAADLLPASPEAQFRLATSLRAVGEIEDASAALERFEALRAAEETAEDRARSAGIALNEAQELAQSNQLRAALERVDAILVDYPGHPQTLLLRAKILASTNDLEAAAEVLRDLRASTPGDPEVHLLEGIVLRRLGRPHSAADALERVLSLAPGTAEAHAVLGGIRLEQSDTSTAIDHFERALKLGVDSAQLRVAYARALEREGRVEESRSQLEQARSKGSVGSEGENPPR